MANQWFYMKDGEQQGPVSAETLRQLLTDGQISPASQVRQEDKPTWINASEAEGLLINPAGRTAATQEAGKKVLSGITRHKPARLSARSFLLLATALLGAVLVVVGAVLPWWGMHFNEARFETAIADGRTPMAEYGTMRRSRSFMEDYWSSRELTRMDRRFVEEDRFSMRGLGLRFPSGKATFVLGLVALAVLVVLMLPTPLQPYLWVAALVAGGLGLATFILTFVFLAASPGENIPGFRQGVSIGLVLSYIGAIVLTAAATTEGVRGLVAFIRPLMHGRPRVSFQ